MTTSLSDSEKRFIQRALQASAPMTFIAHHIWVCRKLGVTPDMIELQKVDDQVQDFLLKSKS